MLVHVRRLDGSSAFGNEYVIHISRHSPFVAFAVKRVGAHSDVDRATRTSCGTVSVERHDGTEIALPDLGVA